MNANELLKRAAEALRRSEHCGDADLARDIDAFLCANPTTKADIAKDWHKSYRNYQLPNTQMLILSDGRELEVWPLTVKIEGETWRWAVYESVDDAEGVFGPAMSESEAKRAAEEAAGLKR